MSIFEALMLVCFGLSWPVAIAKTLRTKQVAGKSRLFLSIICLGYLCGITHKVLHSRDWVMALYILNLLLVATDLALVVRYRKKE
jgi:hypothetical protein